jgi:hypothetical protein
MLLTNSLLLALCLEEHEADDPAKERLLRPMFGMHRIVWPDDTAVEFHVPHGVWVDILTSSGFEIERLAEIQAPPDATQHPRYTFVSPDWARKWPSEEAWIARKRG